MASPESQAIKKVFAQQMHGFTAGVIQQQQTAKEAMLNSERGKPVAQAQGVDAKYYKRVASFSGEQAWRDWAFQFEPMARKKLDQRKKELVLQLRRISELPNFPQSGRDVLKTAVCA